MDGYNEKKWFVYVGDHHEGPFSLAEIESKVKVHQVTVTHFVWCDGMPDWKAMSEVPEFASLVQLAKTAQVDGSSVVMTLQTNEAQSQPSAELDAPSISKSIVLEPVHVEPQPVQPEPQVILAPASEAASTRSDSEIDQKVQSVRHKRSYGKLVSIMLILLVITGTFLANTLGYLDPLFNSPGIKAGMTAVSELSQPYVLKAIEFVPVLGRFISPIPGLSDVSTEEYEDLKTAALTKIAPDSLKVALAVSKNNTASPIFYLSSNLPDGARFDIFVVGMGDTLLNQTSFFAMTTGTVVKRIGKTEPLRLSEGQLIPRGVYIVYAMEAVSQPESVAAVLNTANVETTAKLNQTNAALPQGRKIISVRQYFLGGVKDATYAARLREYHDRLREKAQTELIEVKLFAKTIEEHLNLSILKYNTLKKGRLSPAQKKLWAAFSKEWEAFDHQLNQSFQRWSPGVLEKEYFYGSLYKYTVDAGQAVQRAHKFHDAYFTTHVPLQGHVTQVEESVSGAQNAVAALLAKIKQAESMPATANGMPQREGL